MTRLALALALLFAACGGAESVVEKPPAPEAPVEEPARFGGRRTLRPAGRPADMPWELAFAWLAGAQGDDGGFGEGTATDALALLALLGAGDTTQHGFQPEALKRGLAHLSEIRSEDGAIGDPGAAAFLPGHVLAALAMAQAHQRMPDAGYGEGAQAALDYLAAEGNYVATPAVAPWAGALLRMAREGGLTVGEQAAARPSSIPGEDAAAPDFPPFTPAGRAAGEILTRIFAGEDPRRSEPIEALRAKLSADLPPADGDDPVAFTLSVLAAWQVGGDLLKARLADVRALGESQHEEGELRGSWDPKGRAGEILGRAGVTALHAMCVSIRLHYQRVISPR